MRLALGIFIFIFLLMSTQCTQSRKEIPLPKYKVKKLSSGLEVYYFEDHKLPTFHIKFLFKAGGASDPDDLKGLANLTASLLYKGTAQKTAMELAESFEVLGASFSASVDPDLTHVTASSLSKHSETLLSLLQEVFLESNFDSEEIERLKKQYQAELLQIRDDPSDFASLSFIKKLYDKHPYATPQLGTLDGLKNIKREHVVSFYKGHLIPHNAVVAVVGDFETSKMHGLLEKFFAGWAGNSHVVIPSNSEESRKNESETTLSKSSNSIFPSLKESKIYVIHKPGLSQSQIRIGTLAIPRTHPDYFQYLVSNHLFGGAFGALLNQKIRDDLGLTYSIYSQLKPGMMTGHWAIQTFTRNDQLSKTVQEIFSLLSKFQDLASEEDLKQAKAHLSGSFLLSQETVESMASTLLLYRSLGLPSEELKNWRSKVESINLKQVTHIAQNYWTGKNVVILVLTDEKTKIEKWPIEASVSELSFEEVPL